MDYWWLLPWDSCKLAPTVRLCLSRNTKPIFFCSVVFASIYRSTVLITYDPTDPAWSFTDTVAWSIIEVAAGIISACLPAMKPAMTIIARALGLSALAGSAARSLSASRGTAASRSAHKHSSQDQSSQGQSSQGGSRLVHHPDSIPGTFYPLQDYYQAEPSKVELEASLRPKHGHNTVVSLSNDRWPQRSLSGDEVPLHNFLVRKDFVRIDGE